MKELVEMRLKVLENGQLKGFSPLHQVGFEVEIEIPRWMGWKKFGWNVRNLFSFSDLLVKGLR